MRTRMRRTLALGLSVLMALGTMPTQVLAEPTVISAQAVAGDVYDDLKNDYAQAKSAADAAAATLVQKEDAYQSAVEALSVVENEVGEEYTRLKTAADAAQDELDAAKVNRDAKQGALESAETAAAKNADDILDAEAELAEAQRVANDAQAPVTTAANALKAAQGEYDAATQAVNDAQDAVDVIVNAAEAKAAEGSVRFFRESGSAAAESYLTDTTTVACEWDGAALGTFASFTQIGSATDATALENMLEALDWIEYCNENYRTPNGLPAYLVSDNMMASAQRNANFSTTYYQHALDSSGFMNMAEEGGNAMAENLYYTGIGKEEAYRGWYDEEKAIFDAAVAENPSLEQYRGNLRGLRGVDTNLASQVGHYFNLASPTYTVTGLGLNSGVNGAALQQFIHPWDNDPTSAGTTYTVEEYRQRLQPYYDELRGDGVAANEKQALADAQDVQAEKQSALEEAEAAFETADSAKRAADEAVASIEATLAELRGQTAGLESAAAAAQTALSSAEWNLSTKQDAYDEAKAALDSFDGTARMNSAQEAAAAAESERDSAQAAKKAADAAVAAAKQALSAARKLTSANTTIEGVANATYNGKAHTQNAAKFSVTMTKDGRSQTYELVRGTDYTVTYSANTNAGTAKVTFTGKGDYEGSVTKEFSIAPAAITSVDDIADQVYTGIARKPALVVRAGNLKLAASDYTANFTKNTNAGTASVTIKAKGNFTGTKTVNFTIARAAIAVPKATNRTYNGKAQVGVAKGAGYTPAGTTSATNAGSYVATVTPDANHRWTDGTIEAKTISWGIAKAASSVSIAAQTKTYTGKPLAYSGKVTRSGSTGKVTYKYYSDAKCTKAVKAADVKAAKTYYVKASLAADANHKGATSKAVKFVVAKAKNPMAVKAVARTASAKTLKSKPVAIKKSSVSVSKAQGKVTYAKVSGDAYLTINKTTGKITVKKGAKKGKHTIKVKVSAAGNKNYKAGSKTIACTVTVK
ncbi:MAG: hypothetical protein IKG18_00060 [Atopobiaceae bacterium]|nr:hypothetical protein [Atopobiaceae bacterium]